jgi:hypothetical protein
VSSAKVLQEESCRLKFDREDLASQLETRCWGPFDCSRQVTTWFIVVDRTVYSLWLLVSDYMFRMNRL